MNCKISVIVPVYNSEEHLYKCIDSILNQSFKDIELILVNDGSTDSSGKICDEYRQHNKRVRVIHIENCGVSNARNVGIENARGEYIVFCDSDDYVEYTWCEELYTVIIKRDNSLVVCGCRINNERLQSHEIENLLNKHSNLDMISKQDFFKLYTCNLLNSPCNKIFKKETLLKYNIRYDRELSLGEDMLFNLEYLKYTESNEIYVINKALYNYILRESESLDNKYYKNLFDIYIRLYKELYNYMLELGSDFKEYESDFWTSYFYMIEKVFINTYSYKNNMSKKEKYKYNNSIVKSNEFSQCIDNIPKENINTLYLELLKTKNYFIISMGVMVINKISNLKRVLLNYR